MTLTEMEYSYVVPPKELPLGTVIRIMAETSLWLTGRLSSRDRRLAKIRFHLYRARRRQLEGFPPYKYRCRSLDYVRQLEPVYECLGIKF